MMGNVDGSLLNELVSVVLSNSERGFKLKRYRKDVVGRTGVARQPTKQNAYAVSIVRPLTQ
jgi:hypothetical protein